MKKVRFLLLSILTMALMTILTGCEIAGDECHTDSDCTEGKSCYAGYCGKNEPTAFVNLKFNLRSLQDNTPITCAEAKVENVEITVKTHGVEVAKKTVQCSRLNVHELDQNAPLYAIEHLWPAEDYDFTVKFNDSVTKKFVAVPQIGGVEAPGEANDANVVKLEKVQQADLTIKWVVKDRYSDTYTDSSACGQLNIESFRVKVGMDAVEEACDEDGKCDFQGNGYIKIPCSDEWLTHFTVFEAEHNIGINIYGVTLTDTGVEVLYQALDITMLRSSELEQGSAERIITLKEVGEKK